MKDRMVDVGRFVGGLAEGLDINGYTSDYGPQIPPPPIKFRDLKSEHFYGSITNQVAPNRPSVSLLLTWMFSQINTARILVPMIAEQNTVAAFKLRFVTLFQTTSSLRKLLEEDEESSFLQPEARDTVSNILKYDSVLKVYEAKGLRNNLVHYGVPKRIASKLSPGLPLFGLVEPYSNGKSFENMRHEVALGLAYAAHEVRSLLPQPLTPQAAM